MNRRRFIHQSSAASVGLLFADTPTWARSLASFPVVRTAVDKRNFVSSAVDQTIERMHKTIRDPELAWLFENCFPNTLDTTVQFSDTGKPDTFVITGDIDAMWLRDSTAQVWPYLPLIKQDQKLRQLIEGVIRRQALCIRRDPYANAFYADATKEGEWKKDVTDMKPGLHERKWELDSVCYPIRLAYHYWKTTGDKAPFDTDWLEAMKLVLKTCREQQRKTNRGPYRFSRSTSWSTDTVPGDGYSNPVKPVGLIVSTFRPSDDATIFPFYVPSNWFAVVSFRQLATMIEQFYSNETAFAKDCRALSDEVETALKKYAVYTHPTHGKMYALEVDGYGNHLLQDDANVPNLLALPYLGACSLSDPIYRNTRKFILSADNPYFFKGKAAEGIGSPHTLVNNIWPMSLIMRALTSTSDDEILAQLRQLKKTHANTGFMHESFDKDDPTKFTRKWFAWANTLFGELMLKVAAERPHLLAKAV